MRWSVFLADPQPAEMAGLLRELYDAGLPCDAEELGDGAYLIGPEGDEPRIEVAFRLVDRIDVRDRYAENRPPPELAPLVEQAQLEWTVVRPTGFTLDENERCLMLVKLLAAPEGAVVWAPDDRAWATGKSLPRPSSR